MSILAPKVQENTRINSCKRSAPWKVHHFCSSVSRFESPKAIWSSSLRLAAPRGEVAAEEPGPGPRAVPRGGAGSRAEPQEVPPRRGAAAALLRALRAPGETGKRGKRCPGRKNRERRKQANKQASKHHAHTHTHPGKKGRQHGKERTYIPETKGKTLEQKHTRKHVPPKAIGDRFLNCLKNWSTHISPPKKHRKRTAF